MYGRPRHPVVLEVADEAGIEARFRRSNLDASLSPLADDGVQRPTWPSFFM